MELWLSIAIGLTLGELGKNVIQMIENKWWLYRHRKDEPSTLTKLLFGDKFEEEELLEK